MAKGGEKRGGEAHKSIYTANYILILCQKLAVTLFVKILTFVTFSLSVRRLHLTFEPIAIRSKRLFTNQPFGKWESAMSTWHQRTNQMPF